MWFPAFHHERNPNLKKFNDFKWILEKHLFVEEKVIFEIYDNSTDQEIEELNQLIKEHKDMLWLLKGLKTMKKTIQEYQFLKRFIQLTQDLKMKYSIQD